MMVYLDVEEVPCNNCGVDDADLLFEGRDRLHGQGGTFSLVRCRRCSLIYLNPRPTREEMSRYYPHEYEPFGRAIEDEPSALKRWLLKYGIQRRCRAITAHKKGGRLLDVGCATGIFLAEMRQHGEWELHGVETNQEAAAYARTRFGLDIFIGELEEASYPNCYFDVITLWDVLEHLPDPRSALLEMRRIIRPDGVLLLQTPDGKSLESKLFGRLWIGLDIPRHLYVFTKESLAALLERTGFQICTIYQLPSGYHAFRMSLGFVVDEKVKQERVRAALKRGFNSLAMQILMMPFFLAIRGLGWGSVMTVIARQADDNFSPSGSKGE